MDALLRQALERAEEVARQLADPATARDSGRLQSLGREHARLAPIQRKAERLQRLEDERRQAEELLSDGSDPELAALASGDVERLTPEISALREELHQLLLNVVEVGGEVAADLRHRPARRRQRIHQLPLHPEHGIELSGAGGVAAGDIGPEQGHLALHHLDVPLAHTGREPDPRDERGGEQACEPTDARSHWGATRLSPPAMISNSSRRFWA